MQASDCARAWAWVWVWRQPHLTSGSPTTSHKKKPRSSSNQAAAGNHAPCPSCSEYTVLREYGLRPDEVSGLLQEQCQRFSEYRQENWNWHRDPSQVTPRTVGNNILVFLLFGGFVCHSAKRHRLKPAAFDLSVFGSKHIKPYIMDFLQVCRVLL